jgi:hypothetical protein
MKRVRDPRRIRLTIGQKKESFTDAKAKRMTIDTMRVSRRTGVSITGWFCA